MFYLKYHRDTALESVFKGVNEAVVRVSVIEHGSVRDFDYSGS